jgi:hypothetical protein
VSGKVYIAGAAFAKEEPDDLALSVGDRVVVLASEGDWWQGYLETDDTKTVGIFPGTFVDEVSTAGTPLKAEPKTASKPAPTPAPSDGGTTGTQIVSDADGPGARFCKKCKVVFNAQACPAGHANFMYTKTLPT